MLNSNCDTSGGILKALCISSTLICLLIHSFLHFLHPNNLDVAGRQKGNRLTITVAACGQMNAKVRRSDSPDHRFLGLYEICPILLPPSVLVLCAHFTSFGTLQKTR